MASWAQISRVPTEVVLLRERMRHSAAHIMADAVSELFPETKFAIGPPTEDGFYYDFEVERAFTPDDLEAIEEIMHRRISARTPFVRKEISRKEAETRFNNQPYKFEIIGEIPEEELISTYSHGDFTDLCEGPHVNTTGDVIAFKLLSIAGAYWRGDEGNVMLQRIYGTAFESEEALSVYLDMVEEAERRDHRKLGKELDLFSVHPEIGPGLIIWHPKGALIRTIIEDLWRKEHLRQGYDLVYSPHIGKAELWQTSGHLEFYRESMFSSMELDGQEYYAKPMNCPFHIMYYRSTLRSYRQLPMRVGELGTVYRYERGGVLHGLMRVRGFTQDDAHIFCTPDQVESEVVGVLDLTFLLLEVFGFKDYEVVLSTRPSKFVGVPEQWEMAETALSKALQSKNIQYGLDPGGGAFYGPKIDIKIRDALGRSWQCTTAQFDFNLPRRFGLTYVGADGREHEPYMVHRAILGSLERFLGILIEHYGGVFPIWLAPTQAVIIPISDRHNEYAGIVQSILSNVQIRSVVDDRGERMQAKIRDARLRKEPYMLIVGDREKENQSVSVRTFDGTELGAIPISDFTDRVLLQIANRKD